jgi:hypothetical protein
MNDLRTDWERVETIISGFRVQLEEKIREFVVLGEVNCQRSSRMISLSMITNR